MKVDLHVHTTEYSACAVSPLETQIEAAKAAGLDAIAVTDHQRLCCYEEAAELGEKYKFKIFSGIELHALNYGEDFIVLGINNPELSRRSWYYEDLYDFTRENDGYIFFCHPYRYNDNVPKAVYKRIPDAVEIRSTNITPKESKKAAALAKNLGVSVLTNSDSHYSGNIGIYYNELTEPAADNEGLVSLLRAGAYKNGENDLIKRLWGG